MVAPKRSFQQPYLRITVSAELGESSASVNERPISGKIPNIGNTYLATTKTQFISLQIAI